MRLGFSCSLSLAMFPGQWNRHIPPETGLWFLIIVSLNQSHDNPKRSTWWPHLTNEEASALEKRRAQRRSDTWQGPRSSLHIELPSLYFQEESQGKKRWGDWGKGMQKGLGDPHEVRDSRLEILWSTSVHITSSNHGFESQHLPAKVMLPLCASVASLVKRGESQEIINVAGTEHRVSGWDFTSRLVTS